MHHVSYIATGGPSPTELAGPRLGSSGQGATNGNSLPGVVGLNHVATINPTPFLELEQGMTMAPYQESSSSSTANFNQHAAPDFYEDAVAMFVLELFEEYAQGSHRTNNSSMAARIPQAVSMTPEELDALSDRAKARFDEIVGHLRNQNHTVAHMQPLPQTVDPTLLSQPTSSSHQAQHVTTPIPTPQATARISPGLVDDSPSSPATEQSGWNNDTNEFSGLISFPSSPVAHSPFHVPMLRY
jgi:hypothetical protein